MSTKNEKQPQPEDVERELSDFLSQRFGDKVKIISPLALPETEGEDVDNPPKEGSKLNFNLKPEELISYLDQYIVKQDRAKAVLSTKICTHYNRVRRAMESDKKGPDLIGSIKNNVLLLGPTGVGKTYLIKLIAKKIGVPFVKGDATKFSETGYVGGDVEDLVRDLVREADDDVELAQYGIIYIDEIDKIAAAHNMMGADVSRTGVQRALLKPMEETEVELKVPHDPVSMIQELERFRRTGQRDASRINTKNILFIMSGAFGDLGEIIKKRMNEKGMGFSAKISSQKEDFKYLRHVKSEDLIKYGFESEFVGRLPVITVLETLAAEDLYTILRNPNNPLIIGKKLDFGAYGIDIRFTDNALKALAQKAYEQRTGARGLVSAIENALLVFEKRLPSTDIKEFSVTEEVVRNPEKALEERLALRGDPKWAELFRRVANEEKNAVFEYISNNKSSLSERYSLKLTPSRIDLIAAFYCHAPTDIKNVLEQISRDYNRTKKLELRFFQEQGINITLDDDAVDYVIYNYSQVKTGVDGFFPRLVSDFEHGLKLAREKTGRDHFLLGRDAIANPEPFLADLIRRSLTPSLPGEPGEADPAS
ncbi:AAA family ATPase [Desulfatibacillum aliphaticivorans]|uniref:ATPase AAA-2 domain protein n=1 Tax=Desulfatibacillum aliphaticivorans TaxID=218208 RepID=B8FCC7_DESAL|nr:AAA family ATPase [Desulfatibacillum aliphaticivorans]ACL05545.1 ATPase AAA-2 domain protein [Desulfatibacillum aliphaticivorans]